MTIGDRIREARLARGLSKIQLEDEAMIGRLTVHMIEQGTNEPRLYTLAAIAEVLGTGLNELTGFEKVWTDKPPRFREIEKSISAMMNKRGVTQKQLAAETGISYSAINKTVRNVQSPRFGTLMAMCKALDCTPDELVAGEELKGATA